MFIVLSVFWFFGKSKLNDFANDDAYSFDADHFDGRSLLDKVAFRDDIHPATIDLGHAGRAQLGKRRSGLVQQFGLLGVDVSDTSLGNKDLGHAAIREIADPTGGAYHQTNHHNDENGVAGSGSKIDVANHHGGDQTAETDRAGHQPGQKRFQQHQRSAHQQEDYDHGHDWILE